VSEYTSASECFRRVCVSECTSFYYYIYIGIKKKHQFFVVEVIILFSFNRLYNLLLYVI